MGQAPALLARASLLADQLDAMTRNRTVVLMKDREAVHQAIATALAEELKREEEREEIVRKRLADMRKKPASRDYEDLFRKFMEEEYLREGLDN